MKFTFQQWPRGALVALTLVLTLLVGFVDLVTGEELSFFVFYFIPVSFAAWYLSMGWGVGIALVSTIGWLVVETVSGHMYSHSALLIANTMIRWISYTLIGYFFASLKQSRTELHRYAGELENRVAQRTEKLEERVAELETFSYAVSHNLRAPLRAIEGLAHAVEECINGNDRREAHAYLARIRSSAVRLDRLIIDLVEYVQLTIREPEIRPTQVEPLVAELLNHQSADIARTNAQIRVESQIPVVWGHNRMLFAVLNQFLSNALRFLDPNRSPEIVIGSRDLGDGTVQIWVQDNGIGISPSHQERIFGLFEQLHPYDCYGGGTGMGLAIAKKHAEKMGGSVGVESDGQTGARFWVRLTRYKPRGGGRASDQGL